jgi:hypothetical protein
MSESIIEIFNLIEQHSAFLSVVASFIMAIIVYFFNRKMLESAKKDRERPGIVELLRFCIVPVKEWLSEISQDELQEFNLEEILRLGISIGTQKVNIGTRGASVISEYPQLPSPRVLCADFNALLERLRRKNGWDKKIQKYNGLQRNLSQKMEDLRQKLEKFVSESSGIKRIYEETEAKKNYSFEVFKRELTDAHSFYNYYRNAKFYDFRGDKWSLGGAWYFAGKDIFYHLMQSNESILKEIDKLIKERNEAKDSLVAELDEIQKQLKEEYNLTSLDQEPLVKITRPHAF